MLSTKRVLTLPSRTLVTSAVIPAKKQNEVEFGYPIKREVGRAKCKIKIKIFLINLIIKYSTTRSSI